MTMSIPLALLLMLAAISSIRIIIGPTMWDRLLGLNMVSSKLIMSLVVIACLKDEAMILDIAIVYALLGFIGVMFMSIYLQRKGRF
jgi:multicomponent Na+:H+ antiporter subunit F